MQLLTHQIADSDTIAYGDDIPNYSEAGTGKTLTTLEAIRKAAMQKGLVLAPTIALPMWKDEIENYLGASAHILKSGKSPLKGNADFHLASYGLASNYELRSKLMDWAEDEESVLVLDEGHYLKTRTSARTKAVYGNATNGRGGLSDSFLQCWNLTGTPILRHADDMWAQLRATHPDALRDYGVLDYEQFVRRFCVTQVKQFHPRSRPQLVTVASQNGTLLNELLYDKIGAVRRTMAEVAPSMPDLTYRDVFVKISRSADLASLMRDIDLDSLVELMDSEDVVMAKAMRLLGELKLEGCVDYILEEQGPFLIGYWHTDTGDALQKKLERSGLAVGRVQGGMSMDAKENIRKAFNAGHLDAIVGQISAMNVSWNLQECGNRVVILEDNFSPGIIEQFVKRVWRFKQKNHVQVDFIKAEHPLDEAITKVRKNKERAADTVTRNPSKGE